MRKNSLGITAMLWVMCILEYLAVPLYIWCDNMCLEAAMAATMCWIAFPVTLKLLFEK